MPTSGRARDVLRALLSILTQSAEKLTRTAAQFTPTTRSETDVPGIAKFKLTTGPDGFGFIHY